MPMTVLPEPVGAVTTMWPPAPRTTGAAWACAGLNVLCGRYASHSAGTRSAAGTGSQLVSCGSRWVSHMVSNASRAATAFQSATGAVRCLAGLVTTARSATARNGASAPWSPIVLTVSASSQ
jgi:hypothetical protein